MCKTLLARCLVPAAVSYTYNCTFGRKCVCVFTSEYSVDRGVCSQTRLPSLMEDSSVGQVLREEETPNENRNHEKLLSSGTPTYSPLQRNVVCFKN